MFLTQFSGFCQEVDVDKLYREALYEYRDGKYSKSLELTSTGLNLAPDYHDIRVLQVRNKYALQQFAQSGVDLEYLLSKAPHYEGVKSLSMQRLYQLTHLEALEFVNYLLKIYPGDTELDIARAQFLLLLERPEEARKIALELYRTKSLSGGQLYDLNQIMNLTVKNAVQVTGQYISFSEDYSRSNPWYSLSAEYQHNFSKMALIGRLTYSDRSHSNGNLYEVEAYPVFSDKLYAFANVGVSNGSIFPDYRTSASIFYNFASFFEAEAGFRSLFYNDNGYLTAIAGLTAYTGKFYMNARAFVGPQRFEDLVQNYQFNVRYYLSTSENYIFARLGSGISPDDTTLYTLAQENPTLEAAYFSAGMNKSLGIHHIISIGGGILYEDLPKKEKGYQVTANLSYRYKF
ncbi:YaiO family outer membrane beta-barrel protein [Salinimicrobium sp. TH3]|uniref:YaiO family outer membrane beta-barrel protein n=1 Tax=Salinimicrobium sp. TH3 TaxID=2997342 RepID=UPI002276F2D7|nr:YaiO family outer membrane beta-barrel protein [Salinimicrobium sp. TH3]MCY2686495.1 YaiO family outer membrane beta-barrel protein [Salinimicrobium sp. TH3]